MRKRLIIVLLLIFSFITMGCTNVKYPEPTATGTATPVPTSSPAPTATPVPEFNNRIMIEGNAFKPQTVTIPANEKVIWTNLDTNIHQIKIFGMVTSELPQGGMFIWSFNERGTYEYSCKKHPYMTGTIIVV